MSAVPLPWATPPLTQNQLRRMHHHKEAKAKATALAEARWAIKAKRLRPIEGRVVVVLHWQPATRRRADPDGLAPTLKVALDALTAEGVIPDDSWAEVAHAGITAHPPIKGQPGALWLTINATADAA